MSSIEITFSALKTKTWLHSTMLENRLNKMFRSWVNNVGKQVHGKHIKFYVILEKFPEDL